MTTPACDLEPKSIMADINDTEVKNGVIMHLNDGLTLPGIRQTMLN